MLFGTPKCSRLCFFGLRGSGRCSNPTFFVIYYKKMGFEGNRVQSGCLLLGWVGGLLFLFGVVGGVGLAYFVGVGGRISIFFLLCWPYVGKGGWWARFFRVGAGFHHFLGIVIKLKCKISSK